MIILNINNNINYINDKNKYLVIIPVLIIKIMIILIIIIVKLY